MPTTYKLTDKETGIKWCARLVFEGDNYGLNHCLEHDDADPLVEFYDMDSGAAQKMRALRMTRKSASKAKNTANSLAGITSRL